MGARARAIMHIERSVPISLQTRWVQFEPSHCRRPRRSSRFFAPGKLDRKNPITRDGAMSMSLFSYAAVRSKLRKIGPKVIHLLLVFNAGEDHFGTWNHPLWVLD